jgi:hypothetical protein
MFAGVDCDFYDAVLVVPDEDVHYMIWSWNVCKRVDGTRAMVILYNASFTIENYDGDAAWINGEIGDRELLDGTIHLTQNGSTIYEIDHWYDYGTETCYMLHPYFQFLKDESLKVVMEIY